MNSSTGRWVSGDNFFDRERELQILETRVRDRNHILLTGQRRISKIVTMGIAFHRACLRTGGQRVSAITTSPSKTAILTTNHRETRNEQV